MARKKTSEAAGVELPSWLSPDLTDEELERCNVMFEAYLFITPDRTGRECLCTRCRRSYRVDKVARVRGERELESLWARHGQMVHCRECGAIVQARWAKVSAARLGEGKNVVFVRTPSPDEVHLDCYHLFKFYNEDARDSAPRYQKRGAYILRPEGVEVYERRYGYGRSNSDNDERNWVKRGAKDRLLDPFSGMGYRLLDKYLLSGTHLRYHGLKEWGEAHPLGDYQAVKYLACRTLFPALEVLLKAGYGEIVNEVVLDDRRFYGKLDFTASTPTAILRLDRGELTALRSLPHKQGMALTYAVKYKKRDGWRLPDMVALDARGVYLREALSFCDLYKVSPRSLLAYLERQLARRMRDYEAEMASEGGCMARHGGGIRPQLADCWHMLKDYQKSYREHYKKPAPKVFAKDIFDAHDALEGAIEQRREQERREREAAWEAGREKRMATLRENWLRTTAEKVARAESIDADKDKRDRMDKRLAWRVRHLSFAEGDYLTVIPQRAIDLVREGEALHHCVGTYVERYAKGDTNIVFLRHKDHLDQPLITVEVHNDGVLSQCYGFNDDRVVGREGEWMLPEQERYLAVYHESIRTFAEHYKKYLEEHFAKKKQKKERTTA
jgi:hypothetical protein